MKVTAMVLTALGWLGSFLVSLAGEPDLPGVLRNGDTVSRLRALIPYIKSLRPEEIPAALQQAVAGHGPGRDEAIDALSGRWVELDAPAALAFARQTGDREAKSSIESTYYGAWGARDPEAALKAADLVDGGERANAIWPIAHEIGPRDPQRANELIKSVHSARMTDSDYFIFWNWAKTNLDQATQTLLQKAKTAGFSYPCEEAVWAITDRLSDDDPKSAATWMAQLPVGKLQEEASDRLKSESVSVVIPAYASFAGKAAELDKILWDSNFWLELQALLPFIDGLKANEFLPAFAHLRNTPDSNRDTVTDVLVERWFRVNPTSAIQAIPVAKKIHDNEFSEHFLTDVYGAWSQRDPKAAFAEATRNYHGVGDCDVLQVIFSALARENPAQAYAMFRKLNDANSHLLVIPVFTEWAVRDLPAATKALAHEPHADGAIEGIVIGLLRHGPATAIAWAAHLPAKADHDRALQNIATNWQDDPAAAEAWLEKTPDFDGKDSVLGDVALAWAIRDTPEALHYATTCRRERRRTSYSTTVWRS